MSWLISKALMNSLCLPGQVVESLEENCLDGTQSAPLNGNPIQQAYCAPDKMTDFSRLSRFGMTYKPLTEPRGEELLTLYLEDFRAKTLAVQEKAQELTENDQECGSTWRGWLAKYDPDTSLWRTAQCSLLEDLNESLATLPRSGMTRNGLLWELPMLGQTIKGIESGLSESWPTPDANCGNRGTQPDWKPKRKSGQPAQYTINQAVRDKQTWPTPRSCSAMAATITPESAWNEKRNPNLETIVGRRNWPTPTASDNKPRATANSTARRIQIGKQISLEAAVKFLPTPTCHNAKEAAYPAEYNRKTPTLATHAGGQLNPMWVEWLMGWPLGWTDLKPLVMDKSPFVPHQHGDC